MILSLVIAFWSCDQELNPGFDQSDYEPIVSPESVHTLKTLASGEHLILSETSIEDLVFEWEATPPAGNTVFRYEVLFDTEDGDFSQPIAKYQSDNFSLDTKLSLADAEVNWIGKQAGYKCNSVGLIRWKVLTYCGLDDALSSLEGRFTVLMLDGIDNVPRSEDHVYITGEATEDGGDFTIAQEMVELAEGKYEAYLKLQQGKNYVFSSTIGDESYVYYYSQDKLRQRLETESNENTHELPDGIYRVTIDFNSREMKIVEVTKVYLYCIAGSYSEEFNYVSKGIWGLKNYTAHKRKESWAGDGETRYHFRMEIKNVAGTTTIDNFGHSGKDVASPKQNDNGSFSDESYFDLYTMAGSWDYSFRYSDDLLKWGKLANNKWEATVKTDVRLYFNNQFGKYTHRWTVSENQ